jgi:hypothetical protein
MSQTHAIGRAEGLPGPGGAAGVREEDARLYPLRGDSLAMYTQQFVARAPRWAAQTLVALAALCGLAYLLAAGASWPLWKAGLLTAGVGVLQGVYGLLGPRERLGRIGGYGLALVAVGVALVLFDRDWRSGLSHGDVTWWLVGATIGLPLVCIALVGWQARRFATGLAILLASALLAWVLPRDAIETGVRVVVVGLAIVLVCVALRGAVLGAAAGYARRGVVALGAVTLVAGGVSAAFLAWDFGDVIAALLSAGALAGALYVVVLGIVPTAVVHRGRRIEDDARLANHASKFLGVRLGMAPVRTAAATVDRVDPRYEKLFNRVFPKGRLWRFSPVHHFLSEILDFDQPPFAKNFLEVEVRTQLIGAPQLFIRCWGVTGLPPGERTLVEEIGPIALPAR